MRIAIAPNSFRNSISTFEAVTAIGQGLVRAVPDAQLVELPIADGGEFTGEVLKHYLGGESRHLTVAGPLGETISASWVQSGDGRTGIVEVSAASGIGLLSKGQLNPLKTSTYGTGELIATAIEQGCTRIVLALGGSATVDGGAGILQALGVRLLDAAGSALERGGGALSELARIDTTRVDPAIANAEIELVCDVDNPLLGPQGAAAVFGPQKGATPDMVRLLDANLGHFAQVIRADLGTDVATVRHGGAAGGISAGLYGVLNARLAQGTARIFDLIGFEGRIEGCQLVVTAEGKLDRQTLHGKAPHGVALAARALKIPVVILPGQVDTDLTGQELSLFDAVVPIVNRPMSLETAIENTASLLTEAADRAGRLLLLGASLSDSLSAKKSL